MSEWYGPRSRIKAGWGTPLDRSKLSEIPVGEHGKPALYEGLDEASRRYYDALYLHVFPKLEEFAIA